MVPTKDKTVTYLSLSIMQINISYVLFLLRNIHETEGFLGQFSVRRRTRRVETAAPQLLEVLPESVLYHKIVLVEEIFGQGLLEELYQLVHLHFEQRLPVKPET